MDLINHNLQLEFVDSGLYFVQDENNFIYPLLQVGYGSGEKVTYPNPHSWLEVIINIVGTFHHA